MKLRATVILIVLMCLCWFSALFLAYTQRTRVSQTISTGVPLGLIVDAARHHGELAALARDQSDSSSIRKTANDTADSYLAILQAVDERQDEIPAEVRRQLDLLIVNGIETAQFISENSGQSVTQSVKLDETLYEIQRILSSLSGAKSVGYEMYLLMAVTFLGLSISILLAANARRNVHSVVTDTETQRVMQAGEAANIAQSIDPLSGALTRAMYELLMPGEIHRKKRYGHPLSMLSLRIDGVEELRAEDQREVQNYILSSVGEIISANTRASDLFARIGEHQFTVILPETDLGGALHAAEKIRRNVELFPYDLKTPCTVSVGVTQCEEEDTPESLLERAERAAMTASVHGGNQVISEQQL